MKRDPALTPLSHEHHQALVAAHRLRRSAADDAGPARRAFLDFWHDEGERHFHLEEEVLFPAFAAFGDPHHALLARALCDHVDIRSRARALRASGRPEITALHELGFRLAAHVRLEERELFPLIEGAMPAEALAELGGRLAAQELTEARAGG